MFFVTYRKKATYRKPLPFFNNFSSKKRKIIGGNGVFVELLKIRFKFLTKCIVCIAGKS